MLEHVRVPDGPNYMSMSNLYTLKTALNKERGLETLTKGSYTPYDKNEHRNPEWERILTLALLFDQPTVSKLEKRLIDPMKGLASKYRIPMVFAGEGTLPPHITLHTAQIPEGLTLTDTDKFTTDHMNRLRFLLYGTDYPLTRLVIGRDIYLCSGIHPIPYKVRKIVSRVYERYEVNAGPHVLEPNSLVSKGPSDIFHTTVGRITGKVPGDQASAFVARLNETIGQYLENDPLYVTAGEVFWGTSAQLFRRFGLLS